MKAQARPSDMEDPSEINQQELELARLKRSYRVMQNDYRAYKEQTKRTVNKQKLLVKELEEENEELNTMLRKMETTQNRGKDEQNAIKLSELSKSENEYIKLIEEERDNIKFWDSQILVTAKNIDEQRKKMGGTHNSTSKHIDSEKRRRVLENRLDKSVVYFNRQLAINAQLREDIDHYRRERSVFEGLYKRLSKKLHQTKEEIAEVMKTSTQAFEHRDEAHNKMNQLKERSEKDQKQQEIEMKDLQRIISHDNKMKQFMLMKANDRADYKAEEAAKKKKYESSVDADQIFMNSYEKALERIREVTGLHDINSIVQGFVTNEEENFALYNYVNELNCEADLLHDEVSDAQHNIDGFKQQENRMAKQHEKIMVNLEQEYTGVQNSLVNAEQHLKSVNKALDNLKFAIKRLFEEISCDPSPLRAMLGGDAGISNKTVMVYLGQIEQRATEMLHTLKYLLQKKQELEGTFVRGTGPGDASLTLGTALNIPAPSWDEGSDTDDPSELRPYTQAELRTRIMKDVDGKMFSIGPAEQLLKASETPKGKEWKKKKNTKSYK